MDDVFYEKTLYRILQGRLRLTLGDLVLYISEPEPELIEESFEIYDEAYKKAYFRGVYLKKELLEILVDNELWTPFYDKEAKKLEDEIEDLKVDAFKAFYDSKKLRNIKINIRNKERRLVDYKSKKHVLDHTSCEGVAAFSRSVWLISQTTKFKNGTHYDWKNYPISVIMEHYSSENISSEAIRALARRDPWRSMWANGKTQSNLLGKPTYRFTKDQLTLCAYSSMYDNVYESSETPNEKVIKDDDCLDGWFITQRRKHEKDKKKREVEGMISNSKIANSQEVFVVADSQEAADEIYGLNDPASRATIHNRQRVIDGADGDQISFTKFDDIRQDIAIESHKAAISKIKGGK
tara:strand:- start:2075 stop:3127 length:1053 start_codon:yes stop_codon:yes gene_type:complete